MLQAPKIFVATGDGREEFLFSLRRAPLYAPKKILPLRFFSFAASLIARRITFALYDYACLLLLLFFFPSSCLHVLFFSLYSFSSKRPGLSLSLSFSFDLVRSLLLFRTADSRSYVSPRIHNTHTHTHSRAPIKIDDDRYGAHTLNGGWRVPHKSRIK